MIFRRLHVRAEGVVHVVAHREVRHLRYLLVADRVAHQGVVELLLREETYAGLPHDGVFRLLVHPREHGRVVRQNLDLVRVAVVVEERVLSEAARESEEPGVNVVHHFHRRARHLDLPLLAARDLRLHPAVGKRGLVRGLGAVERKGLVAPHRLVGRDQRCLLHERVELLQRAALVAHPVGHVALRLR